MTVGPNGPGLTPGRPAPTMTAEEKRPPGAPNRFYFLPAKISGKPQTEPGDIIYTVTGSAHRISAAPGPIRAGRERRPRGHGLEF